MKRLLYIAIALLTVLIFASCGGGGVSTQPDNTLGTPQLLPEPGYGKGSSLTSSYVDPEPDFTWDLIAGQHYLAGSVNIWNDASDFHFFFRSVDGWLFEEIHVYVGVEAPKNGAPGQFNYNYEFDHPVDSFSFDAALDELSFRTTSTARYTRPS